MYQTSKLNNCLEGEEGVILLLCLCLSFHLFFLWGSSYLFFIYPSILPFPTYTYPNNLVNIVCFFSTYSFANSVMSPVADLEQSVSCDFTFPLWKSLFSVRLTSYPVTGKQCRAQSDSVILHME